MFLPRARSLRVPAGVFGPLLVEKLLEDGHRTQKQRFLRGRRDPASSSMKQGGRVRSILSAKYEPPSLLCSSRVVAERGP